jgi:hypothetical protein
MSELKAAKGRVVVKVNMDFKNQYTFSNGTVIRMERDRNEFDKKYTTITQGEVIDSDYIPKGATVYFHHNGTHENGRIYNYKSLNAQDIADEIRYFSIPEGECFLWREGDGELKPLKGFATALRVFKPYKGILQGIDPTLLKNVLYLTSGNLEGKVCHTLKACDYQLTVLVDGRDRNIIRVRDTGFHEYDREELVATNEDYTKQVQKGTLYVGLTVNDCKPLHEKEIA